MIAVAGNVQQPLVEVARAAGLIRWSLSFDVAVMTASAMLLAVAGAWVFSRSN